MVLLEFSMSLLEMGASAHEKLGRTSMKVE
jgi:hypothetical protein